MLPSMGSDTDNEDDLEFLRLAALRSKKEGPGDGPAPTVQVSPRQPTWKAVGGRRGGGFLRFPTGYRGRGRGNKGAFGSKHHFQQNIIGGFNQAIFNPVINQSNLISIVPLPSLNDGSMGGASKPIRNFADISGSSRLNFTQPTDSTESQESSKFSRYKDSASEESDEESVLEEQVSGSEGSGRATPTEDASPEEKAEEAGAEVKAPEEADHDVILMQDEDSLGKLLDEFEDELRGDKKVKTVVVATPPQPSRDAKTTTRKSPVKTSQPRGRKSASPPRPRARRVSPAKRSRSRSFSPERRCRPIKVPISRYPASPPKTGSPFYRGYSPSRYYRSPSPRHRDRRHSISPRRRTPSPRHLSPPGGALRKRSPSPRRRSPSPRGRSPSPRRRTPSPRRRTPSPRRRSISPRRRSVSPHRQSPRSHRLSPPRRRPLSPKGSPYHTAAPATKRSISPLMMRRISPSPLLKFGERRAPARQQPMTRPAERHPRRDSPYSNSSVSLSPSPPPAGSSEGKMPLTVMLHHEKKHYQDGEEPSSQGSKSTKDDSPVRAEQISAKMSQAAVIMEARRRKFESGPVEVGTSKKIRLRKGEKMVEVEYPHPVQGSPEPEPVEEPIKPKIKSRLGVDAAVSKPIAEAVVVVAKAESTNPTDENADDLRAELRRRREERKQQMVSNVQLHRILPTRLVQCALSALHPGVVSQVTSLQKRDKTTLQESPKKLEVKSGAGEGRRVRLVAENGVQDMVQQQSATALDLDGEMSSKLSTRLVEEAEGATFSSGRSHRRKNKSSNKSSGKTHKQRKTKGSKGRKVHVKKSKTSSTSLLANLGTGEDVQE